MKTLTTIIFALTLLSLVGCGAKQNEVSLQVSSGFALTSAGYTGGLVVSGKNSAGATFVKSAFGGSSINVVLPDGTWELNVVGWDGNAPSNIQAPFSGTPYCGKTIVNLASNDTSANVQVSTANCHGSDFSGAPYTNGSSIYPLKVVTCNSFYNHTTMTTNTKIDLTTQSSITSDFCGSSFHPVDLKSKTKSVKIIPLNKNFDGPYQATNLNPYCQSATSGIAVFNQEIPVKGLPFQITLFDDPNCTRPNGSLIFDSGLLQGNPAKFDSIFAYKTSDTPSPTSANRLIVSDGEFHRGWSALYDLMPNIKCSAGFCGDLTGGSLFDFFFEINYPSNDPMEISLPSDTDICSGLTLNSSPMSIYDPCTFDSQDKKVSFSLQMDNTCSGDSVSNNICRSPEQNFNFTIGGNNYSIYVKGEKVYGNPVFRFMTLPQEHTTGSGTCGTNLVFSTTSGALMPEQTCLIVGGNPKLFVKASYDNTNKTYRVSDSSTGTLNYSTDGGTTPQNPTVNMLPPGERDQKEVFRTIAETIGSANLKKSFMYDHDYGDDGDKENPNSFRYGSLRRVREFFSPNGPAMLFDHTASCASLSGSRTLTETKDGVTNNYEVIISNVASTSTEAPALRKLSFCVANNPLASTCSSNGGRFEKKMALKKNGVLEGVVLFDCTQKAGRLETVDNEYEDGKYRRDKEILYWNTDDSTNARFQRYSISMDSLYANFSVVEQSQYRFENIQKMASDDMNGRIIEYSTHTQSAVQYQNINNLKFRLYDNSGFKLSYASHNLHDDMTPDFFGSSFAAYNTDVLTDTHFCSSSVFPLSLSASCTSLAFTEVMTPALGSGNTYMFVKPVTLKATMNTGYFGISGW